MAKRKAAAATDAAHRKAHTGRPTMTTTTTPTPTIVRAADVDATAHMMAFWDETHANATATAAQPARR